MTQLLQEEADITKKCLCGYPLPRISVNSQGKFELRNVSKYWQPTFVIDYANAFNTLNIITQHTSLKGMSGGPVFDINGVVYGMDVRIWTRKIKISKQEDMLLRNGIVISVEELKEALKNI